MPIYEYQCEACKHEFEEIVFGETIPVCPECGSEKTHKLLSQTLFKMPGGYVSGGSAGGSGCSGCSGGNCSSCG